MASQGIIRMFQVFKAGKEGSIWLYAKLCTFCVVPRRRATNHAYRNTRRKLLIYAIKGRSQCQNVPRC
eukprot:3314241-Pleurochrysis_carterae.AAC.1